jgi:glutathione S-transferase
MLEEEKLEDPQLELYHGLASTFSKKVRLCLFEKGLPFRSHLLDLQKFEQHQPAYLALNPNGVVPTLVHKGRPVIESTIILEYIEDTFPTVPLRPTDTYLRAKMRLWTKFSDDVAYKAVYAPTWMKLSAPAAKNLSPPELEKVLSRIPTKERRARWERVAGPGFSDTELQEAYDMMHECLGKAEAALSEGPWLVGEDYSLADIAIIPFIDRIQNLRPDFMRASEFPRVLAWSNRLRSRPAFEKAFNFSDERASVLPNI